MTSSICAVGARKFWGFTVVFASNLRSSLACLMHVHKTVCILLPCDGFGILTCPQPHMYDTVHVQNARWYEKRATILRLLVKSLLAHCYIKTATDIFILVTKAFRETSLTIRPITPPLPASDPSRLDSGHEEPVSDRRLPKPPQRR